MKSLKYSWVATHTFWQKKYFGKKQWVAKIKNIISL